MSVRISADLIKKMDAKLGTDIYTKLLHVTLRFHTPNYWFSHHKIALVHLPKTGGTSLHTMLAQDERNRFVNLNKHRPISRFRPPHRYRYITIMRDPVERVWSYYRMVLRNPPGSPYQQHAVQGLEHFLSNCWEVRNLACRYYSGHVKKEPDAHTLDLARANLSQFLCVLSFDSFADDLARFLTEFHIPYTNIKHKRRVAYEQPTSEERNLIISFNALDIELFNTYKAKGSDL